MLCFLLNKEEEGGAWKYAYMIYEWPLAPDDDYGDEVEEMGASLKLIKERITKSKHLQEQIRAHEFRDRSIAERNFERINFWSLIQVIVMIVAGLSQVLMIRSIFDEKSPVRKILFSKWYVCTNLITSVVGTKIFSMNAENMSFTSLVKVEVFWEGHKNLTKFWFMSFGQSFEWWI